MQKSIRNIESLQILNLLCNILNTQDYDEADYQIAKFIINHLYDLDSYSIYRIAEQISVSRSTIRKFCIRMGYENFSDLKQSLIEDYNKDILKSLNFKEFDESDFNNLSYDIKLIPGIFNYRNFKSQLNLVAHLLKKSDKCTIISTGMQLAFLQGFQVNMATIGKVINLVDINKNNNEFIQSHKPNDIIFIVSWTGKFLNFIDNNLKFLDTKICLITFEDTKIMKNNYYKVIRIPKIENLMGREIFRLRISYEADLSIRYTLPFICNMLSDTYFELSRKELIDEVDS